MSLICCVFAPPPLKQFKKILVIAPHPDDEILGCGGYLLKSKSNKDLISWLIVTGLDKKEGWSREKIKSLILEL